MAVFCMGSLPPLPSLLVALLRESEDYAEQAHVTRMLLVDHVRPPCGFFVRIYRTIRKGLSVERSLIRMQKVLPIHRPTLGLGINHPAQNLPLLEHCFDFNI